MKIVHAFTCESDDSKTYINVGTSIPPHSKGCREILFVLLFKREEKTVCKLEEGKEEHDEERTKEHASAIGKRTQGHHATCV